jgi:hypothetical protein
MVMIERLIALQERITETIAFLKQLSPGSARARS